MIEMCKIKLPLPDKIDLWLLPLAAFGGLDSQDSWLDQYERQRRDRLIFEIHRQRFALSKKLTRKVLSLYLSLPPQSIELETDAMGKPFLKGNPFSFNISHSGDWLMIGIHASLAIGVDIECMKERDFSGLARHSFSSAESQAVEQAKVSNQCQQFYRIWCQKEAFIKCDGRGLRYPLKAFTVDNKQGGGLQKVEHDDAKAYSLSCFNVDDETMAAFCIRQPQIAPVFFNEADLQRHP